MFIPAILIVIFLLVWRAEQSKQEQQIQDLSHQISSLSNSHDDEDDCEPYVESESSTALYLMFAHLKAGTLTREEHTRLSALIGFSGVSKPTYEEQLSRYAACVARDLAANKAA